MDREKVIKGLECCSNTGKGRCESSECPYWIDSICCIDEMQSDALELLKEQEAVEPFHRCIGKDFSLIEDSHFDYCPYCGKPITWAKQEGR